MKRSALFGLLLTAAALVHAGEGTILYPTERVPSQFGKRAK